AEIAEGPPPEGKGKAEAEDKSKQPAAAGKAAAAKPQAASTKTAPRDSGGDDRVLPAARRELADRGLAADQVRASGPGGRLLKEDVLRHAAGGNGAPGAREERRVPMSPMRKTIARRLVEAQQTAALLTTFNEADMSGIKRL